MQPQKITRELKKEMEGAFEVTLTNPTERKENELQRKLISGPCLDILESGDKVLVRNLSPREVPRKLKSFWEQEVAEVIQSHENDVTCTIKTISQSEKVQTLHRNMLIPAKHILKTVDDAPNICLV